MWKRFCGRYCDKTSLTLFFKRILRKFKFLYQRWTRGFDDSELWSFDITISEYILPRLIRFKDICYSHPSNLTMEEWTDILEDMIFAFEFVIDKQDMFGMAKDEEYIKNFHRYERGLRAFADNFRSLWD